MVKVKVNASDELDRALRLFKKICNNAGIFKEIKRLSYYEKPSERRSREGKMKKRNMILAQKRIDSGVEPVRRNNTKVKRSYNSR